MNVMRTHRHLIAGALSSAVLVLSGVAALAAGEGSGSVPVPTPRPSDCTSDVWRCSEWGACAGGARTRVCDLETDCATANTPKPSERETCAIAGEGCKVDTWTCDEWKSCDAAGVQRRDCRLSSDCPAVQTAKPLSDRPCPTLQCDQAEMRERILCRMKLEPAGILRENEIRYMPELCRTQEGAERDRCISLYKSFGPCWEAPSVAERITCARGVLSLGENLKELTVACKEMEPADRDTCLAALRAKVYDLVLFRMYDLEERAEELSEGGVSLETIADFSAKVEQRKIEFVKAADKDGRRKAVTDLRADWKDFLARATPYLR